MTRSGTASFLLLLSLTLAPSPRGSAEATDTSSDGCPANQTSTVIPPDGVKCASCEWCEDGAAPCGSEGNPACGDTVCSQTYALCYKAACYPTGNMMPLLVDRNAMAQETVCECFVETGPSIGPQACDRRKPRSIPGKEHGYKVVSTFSYFEIEDQELMICPAGDWVDCYGYPCEAENTAPGAKALCKCPLITEALSVKYYDQPSGEPWTWATFGGDCDTSSCEAAPPSREGGETGYWSAATSSGFGPLNAQFSCDLGMSSPQPSCICGGGDSAPLGQTAAR